MFLDLKKKLVSNNADVSLINTQFEETMTKNV